MTNSETLQQELLYKVEQAIMNRKPKRKSPSKTFDVLIFGTIWRDGIAIQDQLLIRCNNLSKENAGKFVIAGLKLSIVRHQKVEPTRTKIIKHLKRGDITRSKILKTII